MKFKVDEVQLQAIAVLEVHLKRRWHSQVSWKFNLKFNMKFNLKLNLKLNLKFNLNFNLAWSAAWRALKAS